MSGSGMVPIQRAVDIISNALNAHEARISRLEDRVQTLEHELSEERSFTRLYMDMNNASLLGVTHTLDRLISFEEQRRGLR